MSQFYYKDNVILEPRWEEPLPSGRNRWPWALAIVVLLGFLFLAGLWFNRERDLKMATVLVRVDTNGDGKPDSEGSGVFISPKGYILTNRHVLFPKAGAKPGRIEVWYRPGSARRQTLEATLEKAGEGTISTSPEAIRNDWAVLRVTTQESMPWIKLSEKTDFREEEKVRAFGFPLGETPATNPYGPAVKVLQGILNRVDRSAQGGVVRLTHSASLTEGMSGGPLVQGNRLIGINTQVLVGGQVPTNENYALPAYLLRESVFKSYGR